LKVVLLLNKLLKVVLLLSRLLRYKYNCKLLSKDGTARVEESDDSVAKSLILMNRDRTFVFVLLCRLTDGLRRDQDEGEISGCIFGEIALTQVVWVNRQE
jgi:hypothetical protein